MQMTRMSALNVAEALVPVNFRRVCDGVWPVRVVWLIERHLKMLYIMIYSYKSGFLKLCMLG